MACDGTNFIDEIKDESSVDLKINLQEKTRAVREKLHLTQRELASLIGTNQTEISFIERGFIPLDENKIIAINNLFDRSDNKWAVE